jgi:nucleotide-binding universal stress UspA family protein
LKYTPKWAKARNSSSISRSRRLRHDGCTGEYSPGDFAVPLFSVPHHQPLTNPLFIERLLTARPVSHNPPFSGCEGFAAGLKWKIRFVKQVVCMEFKKILCPTDFSEASYAGVAKAVELASQGVVELYLVHVVPPSRALWPLAGSIPLTKGIPAASGIPDARSEGARRAEAVSTLCTVLADRVPSYVRSRPLLKHGEVGTEIVRTAHEEATDLIVLTTHGQGGWHPTMLGAVAAEVLRTARCPVLTINNPVNVRMSGHLSTSGGQIPDYEKSGMFNG